MLCLLTSEVRDHRVQYAERDITIVLSGALLSSLQLQSNGKLEKGKETPSSSPIDISSIRKRKKNIKFIDSIDSSL